MKKLGMFLFFLSTIFCCSSQQKKVPSINFNNEARSFFLEKFDSLDLKPLDDVDKCILKETIKNDLVELNDWQLLVVNDIFLVKSYIQTYIPLRFSLVKDQLKNRFYFIGLPHLEKFIWDIEAHYKLKNDSVFLLAEPPRLVKLNSSLLNLFFQNEVFTVDFSDKKSFHEKVKLANHFLEETFKFIPFNEISIGLFKGKMEEKADADLISKSVYGETARIIDPKFKEIFYDARSLYIQEVGYLLITYSIDKTTSKLNLDFYFLPETERRYPAGRGTTKYRNCFTKAQ